MNKLNIETGLAHESMSGFLLSEEEGIVRCKAGIRKN